MPYRLNVTKDEFQQMEDLKLVTNGGEEQDEWIKGLHKIFGEGVVDQWLLLSREEPLTTVVYDVPEIPCLVARVWRFHDSKGEPVDYDDECLFVPKFTLRPASEEADA